MKLYGVTFFVNDIKKAADWYAEVLGAVPRFASDEYIEFQLSDSVLKLRQTDTQYPPNPNTQIAYWKVEDLDAALKRLEGLGATLYRGPATYPDGMYMARIEDPFGNILGIAQLPK